LTKYGWRIAFLLGGVFGLISVYLRRLLSETPVFEELRNQKALAAELPLKAVVRDYPPAIILSGLLTWLLSAAIVVVILLTPALLEKGYHVPRPKSLQANCLAILSLTVGCILTGWLTDRVGPACVLLAGCPLLGIAAYQLYASVHTNSALLMPLYAVAGLTVGIVAVVPYVMVNAFPPRIRFTGVSFSYNIAYAIFGGLTPLIVTSLLKFDALAPAHYIGAVCFLGFGAGIFLVLQRSPEQ
jgi:MFS family permease